MTETKQDEVDKGAFTDLERAFIAEYLVDKNAKQAAIRAGYAESTAGAAAYEWVCENRSDCPKNKRHVWDAVKQAIADQLRDTKIDANFILTRIGQMVDADPVDIIDEETGAYKKIHDWPPVWRKMLSAADVQELFIAIKGGNQEKIGKLVKYKFIDKLKAYEMLGKHVKVQAFKDKLEVEGAIAINIDNQDEGL